MKYWILKELAPVEGYQVLYGGKTIGPISLAGQREEEDTTDDTDDT